MRLLTKGISCLLRAVASSDSGSNDSGNGSGKQRQRREATAVERNIGGGIAKRKKKREKRKEQWRNRGGRRSKKRKRRRKKKEVEEKRAVTSAGSAELVAVSSLCTYDIYRTYINPDATGKQILKVSRVVVLGFGCFMGVLAVILNKVGVSLGWMYLAMGVIIGSAVMPIALMLLWRKANALGAILGTIIGCILGIVTWLAVTSIEYGRVNLETTGRNTPMLAGNLVAILTGGFVHVVCSILWPQKYDWGTTKQITLVEQVQSDLPDEEFKEEKLLRAKSWIVKWGIVFTAIIVILWPMLSLPAGKFSLGYFTFWAVVAIAWGTIASVVIIILPLTESWGTIACVLNGMFTNDAMMQKVDEMNSRLRAIMVTMPEAERYYLLEKEKTKKLVGYEETTADVTASLVAEL
ncbi:hypothetical protein B296_00027409 [Ensete ventricosum]|uniref:Urea active transporter n=1 Tax=Ensete ventricosum TaxID=4639 RepID=A0A426ZV02_ENSVE|nr:hypothetical protein B296_00027409 [Ensete ventricosum]